jgi:DNA polymerase-3 subunit epsilon
MTLFFDTETTGLPNFNERARHPSQPHIVTFGALLCDDDGGEIEQHDLLVKPDGWTIPKEASDVHGITDELAVLGIPEAEVARLAVRLFREADLIVAHNLQFDKFLCRCAARRYDVISDADDQWWKGIAGFCTMRASTPICKLPGKFAGQHKWPKLSEAYQHAFGEQFDGAHSALADCRAAKRLFHWLNNR